MERHIEAFTEKELDELPDMLEKRIRESNDMKILEYTWVPEKKLKMFVYTP